MNYLLAYLIIGLVSCVAIPLIYAKEFPEDNELRTCVAIYWPLFVGLILIDASKLAWDCIKRL
jgi:hypothetical protein